MIVNVRGTSGAGKSTIVYKIINQFAAVPITANQNAPEKPKDIFGYKMILPSGQHLYVPGKYLTACGGCDTVKTQDEVCDRVRVMSKWGHVLFEGLLISHLFSRYRDLDKELRLSAPVGYGTGYLWAFLDTPLDRCLSQVAARRVAAGKEAAFNQTNTRQKWDDMRRVFKKCTAANLNVRWIPVDSAVEEVLSCFL